MGSNPILILFLKEKIAQWLECWPVTLKVAGSNPVFLGSFKNDG
jgi:hypothetical protein